MGETFGYPKHTEFILIINRSQMESLVLTKGWRVFSQINGYIVDVA